MTLVYVSSCKVARAILLQLPLSNDNCSDFAKAMPLPCTSKNTLRFLRLVKQKFDRLFFLHHLPWNLFSPLVLKSPGLRSIVFCRAQRNL